jgi:hypothetical protein
MKKAITGVASIPKPKYLTNNIGYHFFFQVAYLPILQ